MKLKKYLLATALVGLGSAPTIAADLAARPYTKAPALAAVYDWTGFYLGVNAGVGLGRNRVQHDLFGIGLPYSFYTSPQGRLRRRPDRLQLADGFGARADRFRRRG